MDKAKYKFLPPLLDHEFQNLKDSISERGCEVPIIVDQLGAIIDGHHRKQACDDLKIFCPQEIREFNSDAERFELILSLNCRRRQLSREQKRSLIEAHLLRDPEIADNCLGELIGVSKNTIAATRQALEATCQIDKLTKLRGKDGKVRRRQKRIVANTDQEAAKALSSIADLPDSCGGKTLDIFTAKRRAKTNRESIDRKEKMTRLEAELLEEPDASDRIRLYHSAFQDLESKARIEPGSAKLIVTDPPYGNEFIDQWEELGAFAKRVLEPGGLLVAHVGQFRLDEKIKHLGQNLTYQWMVNSCWNGKGNLFLPLNCISKWIPVLIFSNGDWKKLGRWCDLLNGHAKEKQWHPWQRPLAEIERLVSYFSQPGDLISDPCGGGFTTAVACQRLGRRCISCDVEKSSVISGQERLKEERSSSLSKTLPRERMGDLATSEWQTSIHTLPSDVLATSAIL